MKNTVLKLRLIVATLTIMSVVGCSKDDSNKPLEIPNETVLATFDYSGYDENSIPNRIFANDNDGVLLATVDINGIKGTYELKTNLPVDGNSFTLSMYNENVGEKSLTSISGVPLGFHLENKRPPLQYESNIVVHYDLAGVTDYQVFTYGLKDKIVSLDDDDAGNVVHSFDYNSENSSNKLYLYLRFTDAMGVPKHAYHWVEDYKSVSEVNISFADFTEATLIDPVLDDSAELSGIQSLNGLLNGNRCNLYAFNPQEYLHLTSGFDGYSYRYHGSHDGGKFSHEVLRTTDFYPENISVTLPDWDFSYSVDANEMSISTTGNHLLARMITSFETESDEISWVLWFPNKGTTTFSIPELPQSLQAIYENYFNGTTYDQHYIIMDRFSNETDYGNYLVNLYGNLMDYQGDDRLVKYPDN